MPYLTGNATVGEVDLYSSDTTPMVPLGFAVRGSQGSEFRYVKAGELLVVGDINQSSAYTTNWDALTPAANAAIGATTITVTNSANAVTKDQFKDGTVTIDTTPGLGQTFTIAGNSADASGSATLTINLVEPLRVAITAAASKVTLRKSPYDGIVKCPTSLTGTVVGVSIYPVASGAYGWIQTKGVSAVLCDNSTFAIGSEVGVPGASAGSIGVNVAGTGKQNGVGHAMQANSSGKCIPVELSL